MRITVIGGGIVGLCCALELYRGGAQVVLVERGACGAETSRGNAGWIVPAITLPVSVPGMTWQAAQSLIRRDSPLQFRPRMNRDFLRWCWQFWRQAGNARHEKALAAMLALNQQTVASFDALQDDMGVAFEMHRDDFLIASLGDASLAAFQTQFEDFARMGYAEIAAFDRLDRPDALAFEPALSERIAGGILLRYARRIRPETVSQGLRRHLQACPGVTLREHTPVLGLGRDGSHWRLRTADGDYASEGVVVAAGLWSGGLMCALAHRLPLQAARGHSITAEGEGQRPRQGVKLAEPQVALSPFTDGVRLSGNWDLVGNDARFDRRRLQAVVNGARPFFRDWRPTRVEFEWAGLRPSTPDSLPLIGAVPHESNLYLATGHGMYGMTYGPLTGAAIRDIVLQDRVPEVMQPCLASRWF